ncbi:MAG TPA: hypothetical protein VFA45_10165 [Actinomycetes bacterium]|jgi:hypothetical protein|nr:hypothetical protein [Actinomycetes bacterium]
MLVLLLLTARVLTRLLVLPADGDGTKDLQILVLRLWGAETQIRTVTRDSVASAGLFMLSLRVRALTCLLGATGR